MGCLTKFTTNIEKQIYFSILSNALTQITNQICTSTNWLFCSLNISDLILWMAVKLIVFVTLSRAICNIITDWCINQFHFSKMC